MNEPRLALFEDAPTLRALLELGRFVDERIERVQRERRSLGRAMGALLPEIAEKVGALGAFVRTFGEDLELHTFAHPQDLAHDSHVEALLDEAERGEESSLFREDGERQFFVERLDVAGEWFGAAGFVTRKGDVRPIEPRESLRTVCEELDNFLHGIRAAREKQKITKALALALQHRVLSDGLAEAVRILGAHVGVARLLLALRAGQSAGAPVHVAVFEGDEPLVDTMAGRGTSDPSGLERDAREYLEGASRALLTRFGFAEAREEVLIHGVKETTLVGKILVLPKNGEFDTHDRDLLSGFGDFICQRVVDFNKEYRNLARSFRPEDVDRMLRTSDYVERYLVPREREVAILYVDVSGFTRACEQILIDPVKIGRLVDVWGAEAVAVLFRHGGVFDKMVGDCVIGLFGPPFYESSPEDRIAAALDAATAVRAMTNALPERDEFALLRNEGLAVSTGIHFAPLFVGTFGPNENFTGFSAGMNNTARLQSQAGRNEILVMNEAIRLLGDRPGYRFGETRTARVKNVAQPLEFRPLL